MKIIIDHYPDEEDYGRYETVTVTLQTAEGESKISIGGGESEDMTVSRDLSGIWNVKDMLIQAYNAGKNSEEYFVEHITSDE